MKKLMIVILVVLGTNMYAQITSQTIKETRIELLKKAPNFHFQGNIMVQTITLGDNGPEFVKEIETAINEIAKMTIDMWKNDADRYFVLKQVKAIYYRLEYNIEGKKIISNTIKTNI